MNNTIWFKKFGWIYYPTSVMGFLVYGFALVLIVHDFIAVNRMAHSVSDMYYHFVPYGFIYTATALWVASKTAKK